MATWAEFAADQPELAQYGWELLREDVGYAYLATVTCDQQPRVHPVVPFVSGGRLMINVVATSPKVADLRASPHYMLHATVGDNDTEFAVRGRAMELPPEAHGRALDAQELNTVDAHEGDVIFALGIDRVDAAIWDDDAPHRQTWHAPAAG